MHLDRARLLRLLTIAALLQTAAGCDDEPSGSGGISTGTSQGGTGGTGGTGGSGGGGLIGPPQCEEPAADARRWYVDGTEGDDGNDGLSQQTAFRTVGRALHGNDAPVEAGDAVLIRGGLYRERIRIRKSGTAEQRLLVRPLDDEPVIIDASAEVDGWALESGDIYRAEPGVPVRAVVIDEQALLPEPSLAALQEGRFFYDQPSGDLYVWAPGGASPQGRDVGVLWADDDKNEHGVYLELASHVTLCGLTMRFAPDKGVKILGDFNRVEQCRIRFNMGIGLSVGPWQDTLSTDNEVVDSEIDHNFLRNWPRCLHFDGGDYKGGGWGTGASSQNAPNTRFIGNVSHHNGGEGLVASGGTAGTLFRDNLVFDNWSVNIYVLNQQNARIESNLVYSHDPVLTDLANNGDPEPGDDRCAKTLRPYGIATGDESGLGSISEWRLGHVRIANNVILNCRSGFAHVKEQSDSGLRDVSFVFNTVILPSAPLDFESPSGLSIGYHDGYNSDSVFRNNLLWAGCADCPLLRGSVPAGTVDPFAGLAVDHNLLYHPSNPTPLYWGDDWQDVFTHAEWVALAGSSHGEGDLLDDPGLIDPSSFDPADQCPADSASPAVDGATDVGVTEDFFHHPRPAGGGYDLGACELP